MSVEHVAAKQDVRFPFTEHGADHDCREVVTGYCYQEGWQFEELTPEPLEEEPAVFGQLQQGDKRSRQDRPIRGGIHEGWKPGRLLVRAGATHCDMKEGRRWGEMIDVAVADHLSSPERYNR